MKATFNLNVLLESDVLRRSFFLQNPWYQLQKSAWNTSGPARPIVDYLNITLPRERSKTNSYHKVQWARNVNSFLTYVQNYQFQYHQVFVCMINSDSVQSECVTECGKSQTPHLWIMTSRKDRLVPRAAPFVQFLAKIESGNQSIRTYNIGHQVGRKNVLLVVLIQFVVLQM